MHFVRRFSGAGLGFWFWRTFIPSAAKMLEGLLSPSMAPDKQKMGWKMGLPKGKNVFVNFFCNSYMSPNSAHPNLTLTKKQTWLKVYWYKPLATKKIANPFVVHIMTGLKQLRNIEKNVDDRLPFDDFRDIIAFKFHSQSYMFLYRYSTNIHPKPSHL